MKFKIKYLLVIVSLFINIVCLLKVYAQGPEVKYISFASNRTGNLDIYLIDTNSQNLQQLTKEPTDEFHHAWSPDGRFLAYSSNREGVPKLYVMNIKTNEQRRLTHSQGEEEFPSWSPDGKWIAFTSNADREGPDIYRIDVKGVDMKRLTKQGKNGQPSWSPDSQRIAFFSDDRPEGKGIYVLDADGEGLKRLDDKTVREVGGIFRGECAWSPNGKQIAFNVIIPKEKRMHLCVMDMDGKNFQKLTKGAGMFEGLGGIDFPVPEIYQPAWSPDGKWIAYVFSSKPLMQNADIYVIDAMGNGPRKPLVKGLKLDLSPMWVPELFFSISPSSEKQATLWGHLKNQ